MNRFCTLFFCLFAAQALISQPDTLRLDSLFSIEGDMTCFSMDAFKNIYVAQASGSILQYDSLGVKRLYRYSNNRLGAPDALDVSNPLKTLLFYKNYQSLVLLDRTLSETGVLDFNEAGYGWISAVAMAQDGGIWMYDQVDFSLKKINQQGKTLYQGQNLNNLLGQSVVLDKIYAMDARVYAWDAEFLYVFDAFGQYLKHLPIQGILAVSVSKNNFLIAFKEKIGQYDPLFVEVKSWVFQQKCTRLDVGFWGEIQPRTSLPSYTNFVFLNTKRLLRQSDKALTVFSW